MTSTGDYMLLSTYYQLLFTIEEGLCYLVEADQDFAKTEGERIFHDLIYAFFQIDSSHALLLSIMKTSCAESSIRSFDRVFRDFDSLIDCSFPSGEFQNYLQNRFLPLYRSWMDAIHQCMKPFVIH
ncbi:hypothetical protein OZL92_08745 [Bacillus sonorensis]|uniref:DUF8042 domain-containing protein n=1 Tax=Bacillus sonorensis L12 TaxID=1274524 RepID=M5P1M1_9BACI|nr:MULTISPECIES: hypothetical protein [Bacillus]TWK79619.1 hypothetical protein CHCC20335_0396 [Bacillus paralicheniformis]EME73333.1 hypothetical protein BSONL12_16454 [Bacillus sonorensis L12]MBG9914322.1 hypothetical protein [Bacillus sonorensis]MCF7616434.1 hypothetical protein [Bacillus sonorensis]MCY8023550.1 hypothetical protein [Bacillus sonorensis]